MTQSQLEILISAKNLTANALKGVQNSLNNLKRTAQNVAKQGFKSMQRSWENASNAISVGVLGLVGSLGALAVSSVKTAGNYETLNAALETSLGSAEEAKKAFTTLQDFAAKTPFQIEELTRAFVKLKNMGLDNSQRALTSYGDTASAMGKSLNDMIEAVADAATGEFERLKEFGIKASSQGNKVKFTFKGVTTTVAKEASAIEDYLIKLGEVNFAGGMERQSKTLMGKLSTLKDTFNSTMANFANNVGLTSFAKRSIDALDKLLVKVENFSKSIDLTAIKKALTEIYQLIVSGGESAMDGGMWIDALFGQGTAQKITFIAQKMEFLTSFIKNNLDTVLVGLAGTIMSVLIPALALLIIKMTLVATPFVLIGVAIGTLYHIWTNNFFGIQEKTLQLWEVVKRLGATLREEFGPAIKQVWINLQELWVLIQNFTPTLAQQLSPSIGQALTKLQEFWVIVKQFGATLMQQFGPSIDQVWVNLQKLWEVVKQFTATLIQQFGPSVNQIWISLQELWKELQALYVLIEPLLMPLLKLLGAYIGVEIYASIMVVIGGIHILIEVIRLAVAVITFFIENGINGFNSMKSGIQSLVDFVRNIINGDWAAAWGNARDMVYITFSSIRQHAESALNFVTNAIDRIKRLGQNLGGVISAPFSEPTGRKVGGTVQSNETTLVGENGPELAIFPSGTRIRTAGQTRQDVKSVQSSSPVSVAINLNVGTMMGTDRDARDLIRTLERPLRDLIQKTVNS